MCNYQDPKKSQITICLEESKYAHGLKQEESIHSHNFNRVIQLIKNQVKKLNTKKSTYNVEHQYNTISIFGGRGTGAECGHLFSYGLSGTSPFSSGK